jgi:hypothetical protein
MMPVFSYSQRIGDVSAKCDIQGRGGVFRCNVNGEVYALPHTLECLTMFLRLERIQELPGTIRINLESFLQSLLP